MPIARSMMGKNTARAQAGIPNSYSTTYPVDETPLSEGGAFFRPASGTWTGVPFISGGVAFGDAASASANDSVWWLTDGPLFHPLPHQLLTGTVFRSGSIGSSEIEFQLRGTSNASQLFVYEVDFVAATNSVVVVKWKGNQGTISNLPNTNGTTGSCSVANGDVMTAEITDNGLSGASLVVTVVVKQNGNLVCQADDSFAISGTNAYATGTCGQGADDGGAQNGSLGWNSFSAVTS